MQLPASLGGLGRSALYISTEAALSTARLAQMLDRMRESVPEAFDGAGAGTDTSGTGLDRVHSIQCPDLESQDHILTFQLPTAIERLGVGLVIIDSIAANFRTGDTTLRAEAQQQPTDVGGHDTGGPDARSWPPTDPGKRRAALLGQRSADLFKLGRHLQQVAIEHGVAVVVANQVADWIPHDGGPAASTAGDRGVYHMGTVQRLPAPRLAPQPPIAPATDSRTSWPESFDDVSLASSSPMTASQAQRLASPTPLPASRSRSYDTGGHVVRCTTPKLEHGSAAGGQLRRATGSLPAAGPGTSYDHLRGDTPSVVRSRAIMRPSPPQSPSLSLPVSRVLSLDHQMRWYSGWGEPIPSSSSSSASATEITGSLKTPALGLTWTNLIAARFVVRKREVPNHKGVLKVGRRLECVFASWTRGGRETGAELEIWEGGVRGIERG